MSASPFTLLCLDVDGTLLNSRHEISPGNLAALRCAAEQGVTIALATGRRYSFVLPIAEQLPGDVYLLSSNGAVIRPRHRPPIYSRHLARATAIEVLRRLDDWRGHAVVTFPVDGAGELIMEDAEQAARAFPGWLDQNLAFVQFRRPLETALDRDPVQLMYGGTLAQMERIRALLAAASLTSHLRLCETLYPHRDLAILDVLHAEVNKGAALAWLSQRLGLRPEAVMAVGDNFNDIEMLEFAGAAFLMANAPPGLARPHWRRTLDCDGDGVAEALRSVGLA